MRDVVQDIHMARAHLEDRNYGSADMRLNAALDKLPMDNGVTIDWWELEKRTGA